MVTKEQILAWARARFGDTPYARNYELMKLAYEREFGEIISKVSELSERAGEVVTIEVMVVARNEELDRSYKADPERNFKKCVDPNTPNCVEVAWRVYTGGDDTGVVKLVLPPQIEEGFETGVVYRVKGRVRQYRDKIEFVVIDFSEVDRPAKRRAVEVAKDFLELRDGKVKEAELREFLEKEGFGEYVEAVKVELGLKKVRDELVLPNESEGEEF